MVTKELIERFFQNECSPEEQDEVIAFFKANPEEFAHYWDETEWEGFEAADKMNTALSKKLFDNIQRQTVKKTGSLIVISRLAVAASVLLVLVFGWMYLTNNKREQPIVSIAGGSNKDSIRVIARREFNATGRDKTVKLEDGSLITLTNGSEVLYQLPFTNGRDIMLIGEARFKVAKDKTKPFTVTSGAITTTALGTEFTVTAHKEEKSMLVRLYEGKVVIKAIDRKNKWMQKDVYLIPGQEFIYSGQSLARVRLFGSKNETNSDLASEERSKDRLVIPEKTNESYFMFNNQSLARVLNDLSALYNTRIIYNKKDVQKIYFTGKYDKSEPLEAILKRIATLNNLAITQQDSAYILTK